ncbi:MAG: hypothetical protein V1816_15480 [Pseudomonadota bacterium]
MSDFDDGFVNALTYQVKEEVVGNYMRERLILEEEIGEYNQRLKAYDRLEDETRRIRLELACLLVSPDNYREFFRLLGFEPPPLARLGGLGDQYGPPACPLGLSPRGFTQKRRYVNLVMKTYSRLFDQALAAGRMAGSILDLAAEVNGDITTFQRNYDLLGLIGFLKSMDVSMELKKKFLGDNFTPRDWGSLEQEMTFKKVNPEARGVRAWPELPPPEQARRLTAGFLGKAFDRDRLKIVPALHKPVPFKNGGLS